VRGSVLIYGFVADDTRHHSYPESIHSGDEGSEEYCCYSDEECDECAYEHSEGCAGGDECECGRDDEVEEEDHRHHHDHDHQHDHEHHHDDDQDVEYEDEEPHTCGHHRHHHHSHHSHHHTHNPSHPHDIQDQGPYLSGPPAILPPHTSQPGPGNERYYDGFNMQVRGNDDPDGHTVARFEFAPFSQSQTDAFQAGNGVDPAHGRMVHNVDARGRAYGPGPGQGQGQISGRLADQPAELTYAQAFEEYTRERDGAAQGMEELSNMFKAAGMQGLGSTEERKVLPVPRHGRPRTLADDPERLVSGLFVSTSSLDHAGRADRWRWLADKDQDEAVRELFNWIKAVVWTIEQAAVVQYRHERAAQGSR
jgi:hypothetical protein